MIDLEAIEARTNAATPGPWKIDIGVYEDLIDGDDVAFARGPMIHHEDVNSDCNRIEERAKKDSEFISHAREDIPALIARVRELEAELKMYPKKGTGYVKSW